MAEKKSYNTKQRDEILRCLSGFGDAHFTAADVVELLRSRENPIGQATVYRLLDRLEEENKLRRYVVDGSTAACYQLTGGKDEPECHRHFHLKCRVCGELIHMDCEELSRIAAHVASAHGFLLDSSKTVFYGTCAKCRETTDN